MCGEIISKNINMYDDENYRVKNIWALLRYLKEHPELKSIKDYITSVLSDKTIFRILGDIIVESISGTHNYYVSKESYELLFGDTNIEQLVNSAEATSDSQIFVKQVYQHYLTGTADVWGEKSLSFKQPVRYKL